jgi:hypothetical protein
MKYEYLDATYRCISYAKHNNVSHEDNSVSENNPIVSPPTDIGRVWTTIASRKQIILVPYGSQFGHVWETMLPCPHQILVPPATNSCLIGHQFPSHPNVSVSGSCCYSCTARKITGEASFSSSRAGDLGKIVRTLIDTTLHSRNALLWVALLATCKPLGVLIYFLGFGYGLSLWLSKFPAQSTVMLSTSPPYLKGVQGGCFRVSCFTLCPNEDQADLARNSGCVLTSER